MNLALSFKEEALTALFGAFDQWWTLYSAEQEKPNAPKPFVCSPGCATCCSCDVSITALEAKLIFNHIEQQELTPWLCSRIETVLPTLPSSTCSTPQQSTNAFAAACLAGEELPDQEQVRSLPPCPFLEKSRCRIYAVRPFHCRCFASQIRCSIEHSAQAPEHYLQGATIVLQFIEHLSQGQAWGNMLDVLAQLCPTDIQPRKAFLQQSLPLPGLVLSEDEYKKFEPLLEIIFSAPVRGKTMEDILNGYVPGE